jgi:cyclophilin family peptidyl-prolyl cis-trans isomerase
MRTPTFIRISLISGLLILCVPLVNAQQKKQVHKPAAPKAAPIVPKVEHKSGTIYKARPVVKDTLVEITTDYGTIIVRLYKETPLHRSNFIKLVSQGFYDSLLFHRVISEFMIQGGDPGSKYADSTAMLGNGDIGYRIPAEFNKNLFHKKGALAAARDNNPEKASSGCQFYIVQGKRMTTKDLSNFTNSVNYTNKMLMLQEFMGRDSIKARLDDYNMRGDQAGLEKYMQEIKDIIDKAFESKMYIPNTIQIGEYINRGGTPHLDGSYTVFGETISGFDVIDRIASEKTNAMNRPVKDVRMKMKLLIQ